VAWITYRTIGDLVKVKHWFERSLDAGDVEASLYLMKIYIMGKLGRETKKYLDIVIDGKDAIEITKVNCVNVCPHKKICLSPQSAAKSVLLLIEAKNAPT
jgi:hypothetical protein